MKHFWLKHQLFIVIASTFINCVSQKHIAFNIINDIEFSENMENKKFDIDFFNSNQEDDYYKYSLNDGTYIELLGGMDRGFTEWRYPAHKLYKIHKTFYLNLNLKYKGFRLKNLKIGLWEYYDEQGNLIEKVNEDEKYGKFDYNRLFIFLNERGYVDIQKGDWKDVVGLGFDTEKKLWEVRVNNENGHRELIINDKGHIIKTIKVYEIE